ncbi:BTAD domain-containing putative transcriptional regulator [Spirillospora sp. CA-294931]|uniref:BTAD domain-containing putative transcriptional regulator n=1 Tax=Spirillospora sp. CA-294931 TaxID=3240042 RepID=UPI003D8EDD5C
MRFGVLGPLAAWTDDGLPVRVPETKVRALLADLLVSPGRPVPSDRLIEDLWGERPSRNPSGTLQARVSQLRGVLEAAEPGGRGLVAARPPGYALLVDDEAVDAGRFTALVARARRETDPRTRDTLLTDALELWRGPAFAEFADEEFARPAAAGLEEERLAAIEERAEARLELGEHAALAAELADVVARHPFRERLRAAQLLALYRAGRQSEALDGYGELRSRLADELGLDPSPELAALHAAILRRDPSLAVPERPRSNLPAAPGGLIGRERAVAEVRALLPGERLVTLTGPGGVGKTRLALEAAARSAGSHPDGAWLVELGSRGPDGLADAVAGVLGVRGETGPAGLAAALRARRLLLVLDNCEHVIGPAAALAGRLLAAAPGLRVLATSREPLGIAGERVVVVPPLELPEPGARPDDAAAVRLFAARAAAAAPGFALTAENAADVATICSRLDGIPLALELAAARVRALGVRELAGRLDDRFRVLTSGRRDAPARQRTLRAVIDWSWEPLDEDERTVLRRLAVHAGDCALDAAEAVCAEPGIDVLGVLPRLVDRSLVVVTENHRYRLLESVAAYCAERLREAGEEEAIRRGHARYYTELAERAAAELRGPGQRRWLERLDLDAAEPGAALEHADGALGLRLVNALAWYWFLRGRFNEAGRALATALALPGRADAAARAEAESWRTVMAMVSGEAADSEERRLAALKLYDDLDDPLARARAEWLLSSVHWPYGDVPASEARIDRALAVFETHGDRWGTAAALATRALLAMVRGDVAAMERDAVRSAAIFEELGDVWGRQEAAGVLGMHAEIVGDHTRAARFRREGLRLAESLGLWTEMSFALSSLGRIALLAGDLTEARGLHERALRLAVEHSSGSAEEFAEIGLGLVARRAGDLDAAEAHLRVRLGWLRGIGGTSGVAFVLSQLGYVAEQRGDAEAALALHGDALAAARATGDPRAIALSLEGLAGARSLAGDPEAAARLLGTASAARDSAGTPLPRAEREDVDRATARIIAAIGPDAFATAYDLGRTSSWRE